MFPPLIWKKFYNPQTANELLLPAICSFTAKLLPTHTHVCAFNLRNVNEEVIYIFLFLSFIYYLYLYRFGAILQAVYYQCFINSILKWKRLSFGKVSRKFPKTSSDALKKYSDYLR